MAGKRPKGRRRGAIYGPLSFLLVVAAMFLGMSVFFKVTKIEVTGAGFYSEEEIIEASGIKAGDNLFFINRILVSGKIENGLPYVEKATVSRKLPNRVVIDISESRAIGVIEIEHNLWQLDRACRVLGEISSAEASGLIRISGIEANKPETGMALTGSDVDKQKISYLTELLSAIEEREMEGDITAINFENVADPAFDYLDRFDVKMGKNDNVDYKLDMLLSAVAQLTAGDTGTIDLSEEQKAHFSPN